MELQSLEPQIRAILTAPGTDLGTISAKRVRKQLLETGSAPSAFIREHKVEVDEFIAEIFRRVSEEVNGTNRDDYEDDGDDVGEKRKREEDYEEDGGQEEEEESVEEARPKKKTKASKAELSDAEYARQLSNELNGRARTSRSGASGSTRGSTRGRGRGGANGAKRGRKVKSADTVDSGDEGGEKPKKKRGGGFQKVCIRSPYPQASFTLTFHPFSFLRSTSSGMSSSRFSLLLKKVIRGHCLCNSEPLRALVDADKMSRPQVVQNLWKYIKGNDMQNPQNKREIMCDEKFRAIFNVDKIDMFKMNKALGQ